MGVHRRIFHAFVSSSSSSSSSSFFTPSRSLVPSPSPSLAPRATTSARNTNEEGRKDSSWTSGLRLFDSRPRRGGGSSTSHHPSRITPSIGHSFDRSFDHSIDRSLVRSIGRSVTPSLVRSMIRHASHTSHSVGRPRPPPRARRSLARRHSTHATRRTTRHDRRDRDLECVRATRMRMMRCDAIRFDSTASDSRSRSVVSRDDAKGNDTTTIETVA